MAPLGHSYKKLHYSEGERRRKFTEDEDCRLRELVANVKGKISWSEIAKCMPNRNAKQCRDRYKSYLAPEITNKEWTHEEDCLLLKKVEELGTKWKDISKFFEGRGSNNVKNRWYKKLVKNQGVIKDKGLELIQPLASLDNSQNGINEFEWMDLFGDDNLFNGFPEYNI